MDRFILQLSIEYPEPESEVEILFSQASETPLEDLEPVLSKEDVIACQNHVKTIHVEKSVADYMVAIVNQLVQMIELLSDAVRAVH